MSPVFRSVWWSLCAVLLGARAGEAQRPPVRTAFPEGAARIAHVLLQYDPECADGWLPVCRDLLTALAADVRVTIAVEDLASAQAVGQRLGPLDARAPDYLVVGRSLTCWARDRLLALGDGETAKMHAPPPDLVADGYEGDLAVAPALARRLGLGHGVTGLMFEGGDVASSGRLGFVGWPSVLFNAGDGDPADAVARFAATLAAPVVVVGRPLAPHQHLDMYLTVLGERTVCVGDPKLGADALRELLRWAPWAALPEYDDWHEDSQLAVASLYDAVARDLQRAGLTVLRAPILHGDRGALMTWNNALVERRDGTVCVYMPRYGVPELDESAASVFRAAGCRVCPIDVRGIAPDGGTVRCLTNVVAWRPDDAAPRR